MGTTPPITTNNPQTPAHKTRPGHGQDGYENMGLIDRRCLLSSFRVFFRHVSVRYTCITLKTKEYGDLDGVTARCASISYTSYSQTNVTFRDFDVVKIYFDDGRKSVAQAIHKAVDYALSKDAVVYRLASSSDYRLSQIADYIYTMELSALKYADKASTATDEKFFGSWSQFRKGILKEVRAKRI